MSNENRELNMDELASVSAAQNGISYLTQVSNLKASTDDAMFGALAGALGGAGTKGKSPRRTA